MKQRDKAYWKKRCQLAEKVIEESPFVHSIKVMQLNAYHEWKKFKKL